MCVVGYVLIPKWEFIWYVHNVCRCMSVQSFEAIVTISHLTVVMPSCWGYCSRGHQI